MLARRGPRIASESANYARLPWSISLESAQTYPFPRKPGLAITRGSRHDCIGNITVERDAYGTFEGWRWYTLDGHMMKGGPVILAAYIQANTKG